ncbi:hypothetical protein [Yeosuana aromativorans]|uniref:hypothetical protein n=1 Tax=Yeosuana aromativorans TaxID=288019 RepID=UPI0016633282|nr:hypothetical protein [Yeosuana aromativorans]
MKTRLSLKTPVLVADSMEFQKEILENVKYLVGSIANALCFTVLLMKKKKRKKTLESSKVSKF